MKKLYSLVMIVLVMLLISCAKPASRLVNISEGMTKEQVIQSLGNPTSVDFENGKECLYYAMTEFPFEIGAVRYAVVLIDGRVVSYGRQSLEDDW